MVILIVYGFHFTLNACRECLLKCLLTMNIVDKGTFLFVVLDAAANKVLH